MSYSSPEAEVAVLTWKLFKCFCKAGFFIFCLFILQPFIFMLSHNPEFVSRLMDTVERYDEEMKSILKRLNELDKIIKR